MFDMTSTHKTVQHFHVSENLPRVATAESTVKLFSGARSYWVPRKY